ncbi:MAG: type II secretion system major pseudopilin GspG [Thermoguttaceae bacterium]
MTRRNTRRAAPRGFTLVEILIVLAILVVMISLVVPKFLGSKKKADVQNAKVQIGALREMLKAYAVDMNTFPTTEQGLAALVEKPADSEAVQNWGGPYIDGELPKDPWGHEYQYQYPPTHSRSDMPDIWSMGPDGEDNTEDDVWLDKGSEEGGSRESGTVREKSDRGPVRNNPAASSRNTGSKTQGTTRPSRNMEGKNPSPIRSSRRPDDGR